MGQHLPDCQGGINSTSIFYRLFNPVLVGQYAPEYPRMNKKVLLPNYIELSHSFNQSIMCWGSEHLIKKYIEYKKNSKNQDSMEKLKNWNTFLLELRREVGFEDDKNTNLLNILMSEEAMLEFNK